VPNRILIVDDSKLDRKSLKRLLRKERPETELAEADSVQGLYAGLAQPCDLLFQDISLGGDGGASSGAAAAAEPDSKGLNAIYDVVDSYPDLPIVVYTGYFMEKAHEIMQGVLDCKAVIGFLDKSRYGRMELAEVLAKAAAFRKESAERVGQEQFADEVFQEAEKRAEEEINRLKGDMQKQAAEDALYKRAFDGDDWLDRCRTEAELSGGHCLGNVMQVAREMEKVMKNLLGVRSRERAPFHEKLTWVQDDTGLDEGSFQLIMSAWSLRNAVIHANRRPVVADAKVVVLALGRLKELAG